MKTTQWTKWFLAAGCAAVMPLTAARAVEPIPDWITLVFPTMVPKAGNPSTVPANLETSLIRYSYETRFEDYWKETSYYTADPVTGAKTHGAYSDTKTYGYVQMPWPLRARASRGAFAGGSGLSDAFTPATDEGNTGDGARGIGTPNRRHSQAAFDNLFYTFVYDEADADAVWTSGESFNDADNDGQWDAPLPAEDYWDSDHVVPTYGVPTMYNPRNDYLEYSATGGELFADYNGSASYNNAVSVWLWLSGTANIRVTVNEMDFSPSTGTAPPYEGDFVHTLVSDPDMPGNLPVVPGATYVTNVVAGATNITMTIPKNNAFNYTTDADGNAQWAATGSYIEFDAYVTPDAASESAGWYSYNAAVKAPGPYAGTQYSNAVLRTVRVQLYAARELYGTYKSGSAAVQIFGDRYGPQPTPNQDPARRISNADDGAWTAARNGESFEDFLSIYDPARGGQCYVPCPADLEGNTSLKKGNELQNGSENTRGRGLAMAYDTYTNYIAWNYPGAFTSLIARAFNGRYDGPDDWGDQGSSGKWVWDERDTPIAATPAPAPAVQDPVTGGLIWPSSNPGGGWDPRSGYATWDAWYTAVFGGGITPAPAWRGGIPVISRYSPTGARAANGWTPADSWTFDAPAEYCDLPSSIYHLNGDYLVGSTLLIQGIGLVDPFAYAEANAIFIANGDRKLGEVTSPFGDDIWGQDLAGPMANFWGAADGTISCAGPYCFNTIGGHGYDAANLVNLEFMTHRRSGLTRDVDTHPAFLRDTNLDGYLDGGRELQGDANYSSGMGTMGGPGVFTWHRYMEDVISLWDQSEDFAQVLMRTSIPLMYAYPIYPVATNEGWAALGGPSGQVRPFISRDTNAVLSMTFQVRPLNGGGEAPNTTGNFVPDPNWDPTANPPTQDFGMALLTHEQGHDMMGWPDLYDYDVWSAGNPMINTPVAAYDLMAGGGLVHGLVILKEWAATGGPWTLATDITTLVPLDGGPVTLELYPIEKHNDQYLMLQNPAKPEEYLDLWYTDVNTQYGVIGGRGVYIDHLDLASIHNALPVQQKVNNHFTYEMLQADGRTDLQDGMNFGDNGDPFPGAYNQRTFSADTLPASRWWDSSDTGFRILNVELPAAGTDLPALVTVERYSTSATWSLPGGSMGADTDGDGIVDAWEYHYFHGLAIADATTDYDLDGLSDLAEFKAQLDPTVRDSDGDGISDALEDSDGDQLSNGMEDDYGTNPSLADSDDDGIADKVELDQALDPSDSLSPFVLRHLWNNGTGYVEDPVTPPNATVYDLSAWTVEASVRLMAPPADDIILIRRAVEPSGFINYELGIVASNLIPYVRFQTDSGEEYRVDGNSPVAIGQWTFLGGRFGTDPERGTTGQLSLFVDATRIMRDTATTKPATGLQRGKLRFGINLAGDLDEVRIWRTAQPDAWIDARRGKALEFGSDVAIMGSLTNDLGFLQATFDTRMSLNGFSLQSWFSISNGTAVIAERQAGRSPDDGRTLYNYSLHVENGAIVGRYSFYAQIWIDNDGNGQRNAGEVVNRWGTVELVSRNAVNDSRWHHAALTLTGNPGTSALYVDGAADRTMAHLPLIGAVDWHLAAREDVNNVRAIDAHIRFAVDAGEFVAGQDLAGGAVDEVRLHSTALSATEILAQKDIKPTAAAGLLTYFDFDLDPDPSDTEVANKGAITSPARLVGGARVSLGSNANAPLETSPLDVLAAELSLYYSFDDGRWATNTLYAVENLARRGVRERSGALVPGSAVVDFVPDTQPIGSATTGPMKYPIFFPLPSDSPWRLDSDSDGMPDIFERYFGLDPNRAIIPDRPELESFGDLDGDGLPNIYEYWAGTDPTFRDSDGDNVLDGQEDPDGDGLSNTDEYRLGSHPGRIDTDDDGWTDQDESRMPIWSNPSDSMEPKDPLNVSTNPNLRYKSMVLDSVPHAVPAPTYDRYRFNASSWTIEAWIRPDAPSMTGSLIEYVGKYWSNQTPHETIYYRLGLDAGQPYISFQGTKLYTAQSVTMPPLVLGRWTHLAGVFDPDNDNLALYRDGVLVARLQVFDSAMSGSETAAVHPGTLSIGDLSVTGRIDDVRVWTSVRTAGQIYAGMTTLVQLNEPNQACNFRFDDGRRGLTDGNGANDGQGAEDFAHRITRADLETAWAYSLRGIQFDPFNSQPYSGNGFDDTDHDGLRDGWEDLHFSELFTFKDSDFSMLQTPPGQGYKTTRYDGAASLERSYMARYLGWSIDITPIGPIPNERWWEYPDTAFMFKDVFVGEAIRSLEMRVACEGGANTVMFINGKPFDFQGLSTDDSDDTFGTPGGTSFVTFYIPNDALDGVMTQGWNRISVEMRNTDGNDLNGAMEYFSLQLLMNGSNTLVRTSGDVGRSGWWIYSNLGSMSLPPSDKQGRVWYDGEYAIDGTEDPDSDGLPNSFEQWVGTNPRAGDTNADGIPDAMQDYDGDGVSNGDEFLRGTDPFSTDTDDDGLTDAYEMEQVVFDPLSSSSPARSLAASFAGGVAGHVEIAPDPALNGTSFLVQAWVSPNDGMTNTGGTVIRRAWATAGGTHYELGIDTNMFPYVEYFNGTNAVRITSSNAVPFETAPYAYATNWTHLAASYDQAGHLLSLFVNGSPAGQLMNFSPPASSQSGQLIQQVGDGFSGLIDEVAIFSIPGPPSLVGMSGQEPGLEAYLKFDDFTSGTAGPDGLWGTGDDTGLIKGQIENFAYPQDWETRWSHAATFVGGVQYYTNRFLQFPVLGVDSDSDGVPDEYENLYPGVMDPLVPDANGDGDGDGWRNESEFLAGTSAANPAEYPHPRLNLTFKYTGALRAGNMVVQAYRTAAMDGMPDATLIIPAAQVPASYPFTTSLVATNGFLRERNCYLFAFRDLNSDGTWDAGEPFGLCEENPASVTWSDVRLTFGLRDMHPGFSRIAWAAPAGVNQFRVEIQTAVGANILTRIVDRRTFFHEGDYQFAGIPNGLSEATTYQYHIYDVPVGGAPFASGNFQVLYSGSNVPATPAPMLADGALVHASEGEVAFLCDTNAVRYQLALYDPSGTLTFQRIGNVPVAGLDGTSRITIPLYTNGTYRWTVRAFNPYAPGGTSWSPQRSIVVDLTSTPTGPYEISGEVFYGGKVLNPRFIVQAFRSADFAGLPVAQTVVQKVSTTNEGVAGRVAYGLRGLIDSVNYAGTNYYFVRAFMDQNNNGALDSFESRGVVTDNPAEAYPAKALFIPPALASQVLVVRDRDTDSDRLPDAFEMYLVNNLTTMGYGTVRGWTDTDHDGLNDFEEYNESSVDSNPLVADTDGDGVSDFLEVMRYGSNPRTADTDGDGLNDAAEIASSASPLLADSDADGVPDALEVLRGAKPNMPDTDGDGFPDLIEVAAGTNPNLNTSTPGGRDLLEFYGFDVSGGSARAAFRMARGIGRIAENIQIVMECSEKPNGPWSQVSGTQLNVPPTTDTNSTWSLAPARDPAKGCTYYRLRWKLK